MNFQQHQERERAVWSSSQAICCFNGNGGAGGGEEKRGWWWSACERNDDKIKSGCSPSSEQTNLISSPCRQRVSVLFSHLLLQSFLLLLLPAPPPSHPPSFPWSFSHPPTLSPLHTFSTYSSSASSRFYDSLER